jgi:hypothetical protein
MVPAVSASVAGLQGDPAHVLNGATMMKRMAIMVISKDGQMDIVGNQCPYQDLLIRACMFKGTEHHVKERSVDTWTEYLRERPGR